MASRKLFVTGLFASLVIGLAVLLGFGIYSSTPVPQYVKIAEHIQQSAPTASAMIADVASAKMDPVKVTKAASVLQYVPIVYAATAGVIAAWCIILSCLFGSAVAVKAFRVGDDEVRREQLKLLIVVLLITAINTGLFALSAQSVSPALDSIIPWNLGMIAVLCYITAGCLSADLFYTMRKKFTLLLH